MTQEQLAARIGVDRTAVSNWESGKHYPLRYLGAIEDVLGISLDDEAPKITIPADLQQRLLNLTNAERAYVVELLSAPLEGAPGQHDREAG